MVVLSSGRESSMVMLSSWRVFSDSDVFKRKVVFSDGDVFKRKVVFRK